MTNIVYVLINEAMEGYVKIGITANVEKRMKELDTTPVPLPFECFYAARVGDARMVERHLHDAFSDYRVRSKREFFRIAPERVVSALKLAELEEVTPKGDVVETSEDQAALDKARERRGAFNFDMVGIAKGSVLVFERDTESVCRVLDHKSVEFEGESLSLSASALKIFHRLGYSWKAVAGTDYWMFEGETLSVRRRRMDEE